jgi:hypothetical protein
MAATTQAGAADPTASNVDEPQSVTEQYMASLWLEIIGLRKVSRSDKFLDVGGNSLTVNVVINRIKLERGVSIAPQFFFDPDKSSIVDLARELDSLIADPTRQEEAVPANRCAS